MLQHLCQTVCGVLDAGQIVQELVVAVAVRIGLVVLHGGGVEIERFAGRGDERLDLIVYHIVVDVLAVGGDRNGEVVLKDHGIEPEVAVDALAAVEAALERVHIRCGVAPALVVGGDGGLLAVQQHALRHIRVVQGLDRQTEQHLEFRAHGVAGIGGNDELALCSHGCRLVQTGIVGIQIGVAQLLQFLGEYPEVGEGLGHDLNDVWLYAVLEVGFRNVACQILPDGVVAVLGVVRRLIQLVGEILRTGLHKERQKTVVLELLVENEGVVCLLGVQTEQRIDRPGDCRNGNDHHAADQAGESRQQTLAQLGALPEPWVEPERQQNESQTDRQIEDQSWCDLDVGKGGQALQTPCQFHVCHDEVVAVGVVLEKLRDAQRHVDDAFHQHGEPSGAEQQQQPCKDQRCDQNVEQHDGGVFGDEEHQLAGVLILIQLCHADNEQRVEQQDQPIGHGEAQGIVGTLFLYGASPGPHRGKPAFPRMILFHLSFSPLRKMIVCLSGKMGFPNRADTLLL